MSQGFHQGIYNVYQRSVAAKPPAEWMPREQGGFDAGGMLTEIINLPWRKPPDVLEDQIHHRSYSLPHKQQQLSAIDELSFMNNPQVKAASPSNLEGFQLINSQHSRVSDGQGLSLSLSCLRNLESSKLERINGELYLHSQGIGTSTSSYGLMEEMGAADQVLLASPHVNQIRFGYAEASRGTNSLKNSRYMKAAQELLMEFCCVGRGQFVKKQEGGNPNPASDSGGGSSSSKDHCPMSLSERTEYQRRKIRLLSMLDELGYMSNEERHASITGTQVEGRYARYCEQMQAVVNSFDAIMGKGSAGPYTGLARRAMSQHFRSMKDAVAREVKACCEALGEKEVKGGITKGETPRLKAVEQKYRRQQMGMMEAESWRPQRGLPERSVTALRAWLFQHFLHPYPSEADKHLLSRQTGLSKNQVSNWFINARVRLWKPMVEDMYQQEFQQPKHQEASSHDANSETNAAEKEPSSENTQPGNQAAAPGGGAAADDLMMPTEYRCFMENPEMELGTEFELVGRGGGGGGNLGTQAAGEVSLKLGLRRTENVPIMSRLSVRDFKAY